MSLSAVVITFNAAKTIDKCLRSLKFADNLIVIDSKSTDETVDIAKKHDAKIYVRDWPGYGAQKNFGLSKSITEWTLFIDADEEVSPKLANEISKISSDSSLKLKNFYWIRIVTTFLNKPLKHLYGHNLRLFKKGLGSWTTATVHEQVQTNQEVQIKLNDNYSDILTNHLVHHSHKTVSSYLKKMHHYTTLDAQQMTTSGLHRSGRKVSANIFLPFYLSFRQLIKLLLYRRGILDGLPGILWCTLSAYYEFEMAIKFIRHSKNSNSSSRHG